MKKSRFRNKILRKLLLSPWTILPTMFGASALISAVLQGKPASIGAFLGICALLGAIGSLATRWIFGLDKMAAESLREMQIAASRAQEQSLDRLEQRLLRDGDERTENSLRELRELYRVFKDDRAWTKNLTTNTALEIAGKVDDIFEGCQGSLRRSVELWESASRMRMQETRDTLLRKRERLLNEVNESVRQLAKTVDGVETLSLDKDNSEHLARLRRELDESLDVARRVEERMRKLDSDMDPSLSRAGKE